MTNDIKSMVEAIERISNVRDNQMFQSELASLRDHMKELGMGKDGFLELERNAYCACRHTHLARCPRE